MIGTRIARYRIVAELGSGGMGVVYRARDESLGRDVALKLLPAALSPDEPSRRRLVQEARAAAALNHPSICAVYEADVFEGRAFIAMELVEGPSLAERIAGRALPVESVLHLGIQMADALAHAHDRGVVHRDLKPSNVVIGPDGRARILDFGIARRARVEAAETTVTLTAPGTLVGTPGYMAPEVLGGAPADARTDVWALGCILHEMVTGRAPFRGDTLYAVAAAILNAEPEPLPAGLPAGLRAAIRRCLTKDPERRYARAGEVRAALEAIREGALEPEAPVPASAPAAPAPVPAAQTVGAEPVAQRRSGRGWWVVLALGAPVLGIALLLAALLGPRLMRRPAGGTPIRSLAVLPLENLSGDPEQEYFSDGMTEELIASLANLEGVRVISRTSVMRYKNTDKTIPQIARELGVDAVVEGSALRSGDQVRITAQLIEASTDRHLWAKSYHRSLANVLALQGEVAQAIANEVRAALTPRGRERAVRAPRVDPVAYEEYLRGRHEWGKRTGESLRLAIAHFERAIAADSTYVPAWAGLADVHVVSSPYLQLPPRETYPRARAAARRALALDEQSAQGHATLGVVLGQYDHDWAGAEAEFRKAIALSPSYATAHQWYGLQLAFVGRLEDALAALDRARELDPLSGVVAMNRAMVLEWLRRSDEALAAAREVASRHPGFASGRLWFGRVLLRRGEFAAALPHLWAADSLEGVGYHRDAAIRAALIAGDETRYWRRLLALLHEAGRERYLPANAFILGYARIGDHDRALRMMERSLEDRDITTLFGVRDPGLDALRSDPRFAPLLRRYGLER